MRFIFLSLSVLAAGFSCRAADRDGLLPTGGFRIRDPFVLAENGTYYLYEAKPWSGGRGVNVFTSKDLKSWTPKVPVMELPASNAILPVPSGRCCRTATRGANPSRAACGCSGATARWGRSRR